MIKRRGNDAHRPGEWEIPGGRLQYQESPFEGLKRETKEEIGLEIEILSPLKVHSFTRQDGQKILMITFLCHPASNEIKLSEEHTEFKWLPLDRALELITPSFREEIGIYKRLFGKI